MDSELLEQRSDDWFKIRLGKVTGSRIADLTAEGKNGQPSASRANYIAELVTERLTGQPAENLVKTPAMIRGAEIEPRARLRYEFLTDMEIEEVGFVHHPTIPMSGASPDGRVGMRGLVQFKAPHTASHIEYLRGANIEGKYLKQMTWEMLCDQREFCDFVSFDDRLPEPLQMFVKRVLLDEKLALDLERKVRVALAEIDAIVADLNHYGLSPAECTAELAEKLRASA